MTAQDQEKLEVQILNLVKQGALEIRYVDRLTNGDSDNFNRALIASRERGILPVMVEISSKEHSIEQVQEIINEAEKEINKIVEQLQWEMTNPNFFLRLKAKLAYNHQVERHKQAFGSF